MNKDRIKEKKLFKYFFLLAFVLFFSSCQESQFIINNIDEKEANEIIVYLATKGIDADKVASTAGTGPGGTVSNLWNISVDPNKAVQAMATLNRAGLPKRKGTTLLELFAKSTLMTTDREQAIRYQSGLEQELENTIRKIDGVLDVDVQISSLPDESIAGAGTETKKIKAAVYVKHQGILDNPNNHLETKIRRLLSGGVDGLDFENVSVISDKSLYNDLSILGDSELISSDKLEKDYVSIWSVIMTKKSSSRFRTIFFILIFIIIVFASAICFLIYKFYPLMQKMYLKQKLEKDESLTESSEENIEPK
jgi:type III secretion protein J